MDLAAEIKRLRLVKSFTQVELAEAAGLSQGFVAMIEGGKRSELTAAVVYKLADALGVPSDHFRPFLLADTPAPPSTHRPRGKYK